MRGTPLPQEKEIRIDLPVKAFVPPGWVAQEALRLDLYRRIGGAADHAGLAEVRTETIDRYGRLPAEVETLFAVASLRLTCEGLDVDEVTTYKQQVRITPLALSSSLEIDLAQRVPGATYHATTKTLNLEPDRVAGADLPRWIEERLAGAAGLQVPVARMAR
jgi:transcription-repair coupling factor (superfamily II helicase)